MTTTNVTITQEMLDAAGAVEQAIRESDMTGILFLEVAGGMWAIYNEQYRQALALRFGTRQVARGYALRRLMGRA
jgi:threonine/homoserine efflux transporter RhtA